MANVNVLRHVKREKAALWTCDSLSAITKYNCIALRQVNIRRLVFNKIGSCSLRYTNDRRRPPCLPTSSPTSSIHIVTIIKTICVQDLSRAHRIPQPASPTPRLQCVLSKTTRHVRQTGQMVRSSLRQATMKRARPPTATLRDHLQATVRPQRVLQTAYVQPHLLLSTPRPAATRPCT
jgi:hypothetical protein